VNAFTIIALALKYGPTIISVLKALEPLLEAAKPVVEKMMAEGIEEHVAWPVVLKHYQPGSIEEQRWFDRAMGDVG
jgi:hypothetical protein